MSVRREPGVQPVIITAALTGAQQGKEADPNLPEQPEEIIAQAVECAKAGAAIVPPLRATAHDSGPVWVATPSPRDSFIHYTSPV